MNRLDQIRIVVIDVADAWTDREQIMPSENRRGLRGSSPWALGSIALHTQRPPHRTTE
jgi:hypothetical protein